MQPKTPPEDEDPKTKAETSQREPHTKDRSTPEEVSKLEEVAGKKKRRKKKSKPERPEEESTPEGSEEEECEVPARGARPRKF
jgi:hypothetical protein